MAGLKVLGLGQLSACGTGIESLVESLNGDCPEPDWAPTANTEPAETSPVLRAVVDVPDGLLSPRAMRRVDRFSANFVVASLLAVRDSGMELPPPERLGVVMGTGYGSLVTSFSNLDDIIEHGDSMSSPFKFATSVNNAPSSSVSNIIGARGPCLAVTGFRNLLSNVVKVAACWLRAGLVDMVIAGTGDEYHPIIGYGLHADGGWAPDGRVQPLDHGRTTYVPGEMYAAMVLVNADSWLGARGYCNVAQLAEFDKLDGDYRPPADRVLFLAADGSRESTAAYMSLMTGSNPVAAYTSLWGGSPAGEALTMLAACTTARKGSFPGMPRGSISSAGVTVPEEGAGLASGTVDCVCANPDGSGTVIELTVDDDNA